MTLPDGMPRARYVVRYAGRNISVDLAEYLTSLAYTDYLSGQSDELELELEDKDGRWRDAWYPGKGDTLDAEIGWDGEALVPIGTFVIDEITFSGGPNAVTIRALAASIGTAVRTTEYIAYEKTTLDGIAQRIAKRHGLELVGKIEPIAIDRITQSESDGAFLTKLADEYDYAFKLVGKQLVFHTISELTQAEPVARIKLDDFKPGWTIRDQIKDVPKAVEVKSSNPAKGKLVTYTMKNGEPVAAASPSSVSKATSSADTMKSRSRSGSDATAEAKARADLARANREQTVGNGHLMGRPRLVAGSVMTLSDGGKLDGEYLVQVSRHQLDASGGYDLGLDFCRIRETTDKPGQVRKPSAAAKKTGGLAVYGIRGGEAVRVGSSNAGRSK